MKKVLLNLFPVLLIVVISTCKREESYTFPVNKINEMGQDFLIYDMVIDRFDNKWFGTSAGLIKYADDTIIKYTKANGLASDTIWTLAADTYGNVWCINHNNYISKFDGQSFTLFKMTDPTCINVDKHNTVWVAAFTGLFKYTDNGWQNFYSKYGLSNNWARSIFTNSTNNIYILGTNNNILKFDGNNYEQLESLYDFKAATFNYLIEDGTGKTYCAILNQGLLIVNNNQKNMIQLSDNLINTIALDKNGRIWLGAESGLFYINEGQTVRIRSLIEDFSQVKKIEIDRYNNVWFLSKNNLYKYTQ